MKSPSLQRRTVRPKCPPPELACHALHELAATDGDALRPALVAALGSGQCIVHGSFVEHCELFDPIDLQYLADRIAVDDPVAFLRTHDLVIAGVRPVAWVGDHPGSHHVEVDVGHAAPEMLAGLDRGGAIAILPVAAETPLAPVVSAGEAAFEELHAVGNLPPIAIAHDQVNVIRGRLVVEDTQPKAPADFEQPPNPGSAIAGKAQEKAAIVTAMRQMPDIAR